jgi:hypothetical protein
LEKEIAIIITAADLRYIVEEGYDAIVDLAKYNSYCSNCTTKYEVGMIDYSLEIDYLNDVVFKGRCKRCAAKIVRVVEIGGQPRFKLRIQVVKSSKVQDN